VEIFCRLRQATYDNMVQCMRLACSISRLRREYRHTLRIINTYCFCTSRIVTPTCLDITLYVMFILRLSLFLTPGVTTQSHWHDVGLGSNSLRKGVLGLVRVKVNTF
jgi:hypothetical protein